VVDVPGDEVRRAQDEYLAASEALRAVLRRLEDEVRAGRAHLDGGGTAGGLPEAAGVPTINPVLNEHIDQLERARQRTRRAYFGMAVDEGLSHGEIARRWGISRQLVSRILGQASTDRDAEAIVD